MNLVPLFFLMALGRRSAASPPPTPPLLWPTAASPPPPMPALPPSAPSADSGTPLSDLAAASVAPPPPPSAAAPPSDVRKAKAKAMAKAKQAAAKKGKTILQRIVKAGPPAPAQTDVSVASLQSVLARRGYKAIKRDGLYGPKTESAWKALAASSKLSPMISRRGPKLARVAKDTYTTLSIP